MVYHSLGLAPINNGVSVFSKRATRKLLYSLYVCRAEQVGQFFPLNLRCTFTNSLATGKNPHRTASWATTVRLCSINNSLWNQHDRNAFNKIKLTHKDLKLFQLNQYDCYGIKRISVKSLRFELHRQDFIES